MRSGRRLLPTRVRLALLAAGAVVVALAVAACVFVLSMRAKVEADAIESIEVSLGWADDEYGTYHTTYYVPVSLDGDMGEGMSYWYTDEERALLAWAAKGPERQEIQRVELGEWVAYAVLVEGAFLEAYYTPSHEMIAYVDISDEEDLVGDMVGAFAIVGALGAAGAAGAAYLAGRRIEVSEEARKRFYENMSHELKTPLAAIRGYAEGIETGVLEARAAAHAIVGETRRSSELVEGILGLARIDAGAVELSREWVEVADLVQDCLMPFEGIVRTRGIEVGLSLADGSIDADPDQLGHAIENILSNAIRHARTTVRVSYDGRRLAIWNDAAASELPSADELDGLFERYRTGAGGSTGIGLALAREIVVLHGWQLVASLEDGGLAMAVVFG